VQADVVDLTGDLEGTGGDRHGQNPYVRALDLDVGEEPVGATGDDGPHAVVHRQQRPSRGERNGLPILADHLGVRGHDFQDPAPQDLVDLPGGEQPAGDQGGLVGEVVVDPCPLFGPRASRRRLP
jgi:hypothetical protein